MNFTIGQNLKIEIDFLGRKPINIVLENTKDAEKQHLGGNVF